MRLGRSVARLSLRHQEDDDVSFSAVFSRAVALVGGAALWSRRLSQGEHTPAWGSTPAIPGAKPQGAIPTLKMPTARGWPRGKTPIAAPGLKVNAFATNLDHPRWIEVLPNGDVLVAEAMSADRPPRSLFDYAMVSTLRRADAMGVSANRITLLRDADKDGVAEIREVFLGGLNQPFGMALVGDTFYVGNTDGLVAFPYTRGATRITARGRQLTSFKPAGHWTRSLLPSPDRQKLYVGVGSLSNIGDYGMDVEAGRAAIYEYDTASDTIRIFASGLRNPVGMAWEPNTGVLWTVVNERDGLGDETPPDYLTSVRDGGFYGWPWFYLGPHQDPRHAGKHPELRDQVLVPDVLLQSHSASLGMMFYTGTQFPPEYRLQAFAAEHGSWNRARRTGYKVIWAVLKDGVATGEYVDFMTGLVTPEGNVWGRPVAVTQTQQGALVVSDDGGNCLWRIRHVSSGT